MENENEVAREPLLFYPNVVSTAFCRIAALLSEPAGTAG
jgi:hypothetical protein